MGAETGVDDFDSTWWPLTVAWRFSPPAVVKALAHPGDKHLCVGSTLGEVPRGERNLIGVVIEDGAPDSANGLRERGEVILG